MFACNPLPAFTWTREQLCSKVFWVFFVTSPALGWNHSLAAQIVSPVPLISGVICFSWARRSRGIKKISISTCWIPVHGLINGNSVGFCSFPLNFDARRWEKKSPSLNQLLIVLNNFNYRAWPFLCPLSVAQNSEIKRQQRGIHHFELSKGFFPSRKSASTIKQHLDPTSHFFSHPFLVETGDAELQGETWEVFGAAVSGWLGLIMIS